MSEQSIEELRERAALLREIADLETSGVSVGETEADEADEGRILILRELLGEWRKQQIVQDTESPTFTEEYFGLAAVLDREAVEMLEEAGWEDPCPRDWHLAPPTRPAPTVSRETSPTPRIPRQRLRPVAVTPVATQAMPASLADQLSDIAVRAGAPDVAALVQAEAARIVAEQEDARRVLAWDDDTPEELRMVLAKPPRIGEQIGAAQMADAAAKKARKKAKKARKADPVERYYADGSPVIDAASSSTAPSPAVDLAEALTDPSIQAEIAPPAGWVTGPDGRLVNTAKRAPVKAVYPPVRGRGRHPAIAIGGMRSSQDWVRDPSSGKRVPRDQVNTGD